MTARSSDIVIIGAGIAGLVAAHECLDNGRSVTLVERHDEDHVGGLARWAFGGMALVGTPLQKRLGINDTPELALSDWRSFAEFGADDTWPQEWAQAYVEQSAERVFHWLRDKSMRFMPAVNWVERGDFLPGNSVPRYHILWGTGIGLVERFVELLAAHPHRDKLHYVFGCRVDELVEEGGRIQEDHVIFGDREVVDHDGVRDLDFRPVGQLAVRPHRRSRCRGWRSPSPRPGRRPPPSCRPPGRVADRGRARSPWRCRRWCRSWCRSQGRSCRPGR